MIKLEDIFSKKKPIIGMIHLAGNSAVEKIDRALEEITIYEKRSIDAVIIEDYHGTPGDILRVLEKSKGFTIIRGINVLSDSYSGFRLAQNFGARFVQFDSVQRAHINLKKYEELRNEYSAIAVLGGVRFKYKSSTGNNLEEDIADGKLRCDAIVTTGEGTGIETPIQKLRDFKKYLMDFPLIVGAGLNDSNVLEQLKIADGGIVGSFFKKGNQTDQELDEEKIKRFMGLIDSLR